MSYHISLVSEWGPTFNFQRSRGGGKNPSTSFWLRSAFSYCWYWERRRRIKNSLMQVSTSLASDLTVSPGTVLERSDSTIYLGLRVSLETFDSFDKLINLVAPVTFAWICKLSRRINLHPTYWFWCFSF